MLIKALAENTSVCDEYGSEHGLSLYVETKAHKLLFDMGRGELFAENAKKMNVHLSKVDIAVISHGHMDHGGGLQTFLQINENANVYLHQRAFEGHYSSRPDGVGDISLDQSLKDNSRLIFSGDYRRMDGELELFSGVTGKKLWSKSNDALLMGDGADLTLDTFAHEQNLIVSQNGKLILFAGCAHNGIVNIIDKFVELKGTAPHVVIGGFHLFNPGTGKSENRELIDEIGKTLLSFGSTFYTCHCTGLEAYEILKEVMGGRIRYLSTGAAVDIC